MKTSHGLTVISTTIVATSCGIAVSARNRFTETGFLAADTAEILGSRDHQDNPFVLSERDPAAAEKNYMGVLKNVTVLQRSFPMFIPLHLNLLHLA